MNPLCARTSGVGKGPIGIPSSRINQHSEQHKPAPGCAASTASVRAKNSGSTTSLAAMKPIAPGVAATNCCVASFDFMFFGEADASAARHDDPRLR